MYPTPAHITRDGSSTMTHNQPRKSPLYPPNQCPTCGGKHWSPREVAACAQFGPAVAYVAPAPTEPPVTQRQLDYIADLGGNLADPRCKFKRTASEYISWLKAQPRPTAANSKQAALAPSVAQAWQDPKHWPLKTPQAMVQSMRDGRYAVTPDETIPLTFIRIVRPKRGNYADAFLVQTQHSDNWVNRVIVWPSGNVQCQPSDRWVDEKLMILVCDPTSAQIRYGVATEHCCNCGKTLTDERSRWYGIGPDCEERFPEIITRTDNSRGAYVPGAGMTK